MRQFSLGDVKNRIEGFVVGFATGDALGAPGAGLPGPSFLRSIGPIRGFVVNRRHPYFSNLGLGCYTENTRLFCDAALDYAKMRGFDGAIRKKTLISWAERIVADPDLARWPGATTLDGALGLARGAPSFEERHGSVGATYRCLPIAAIADPPAMFEMVKKEVELTHRHPDAVFSAYLIVLIARDILLGKHFQVSLMSAISCAEKTFGYSDLARKCRNAVSSRGESADLYREFGTGARCDETIPLSLAIITNFGDSLEYATMVAANSFKLANGGSWDRATADKNGGNTDGIAAIVCSLLGAYYGGASVTSCWAGLEDVSTLLKVAQALAAQFKQPHASSAEDVAAARTRSSCPHFESLS